MSKMCNILHKTHLYTTTKICDLIQYFHKSVFKKILQIQMLQTSNNQSVLF